MSVSPGTPQLVPEGLMLVPLYVIFRSSPTVNFTFDIQQVPSHENKYTDTQTHRHTDTQTQTNTQTDTEHCCFFPLDTHGLPGALD